VVSDELDVFLRQCHVGSRRPRQGSGMLARPSVGRCRGQRDGFERHVAAAHQGCRRLCRQRRGPAPLRTRRFRTRLRHVLQHRITGPQRGLGFGVRGLSRVRRPPAPHWSPWRSHVRSAAVSPAARVALPLWILSLQFHRVVVIARALAASAEPMFVGSAAETMATA
jgi:hypothetical protein